MDWRIAEIALIKKATVALGLTPEMRKAMRRYAVPALYAVWEGFVTTIFSEYARRINHKRIPFEKANINIAQHDCFDKVHMLTPPTCLEQRNNAVGKLRKLLKGKLVLSETVRTNSNVDYAELTKILARYGVEPLDKVQYEDELRDLLAKRNCIAHGNHGIEIEAAQLEQYASLVDRLMNDICEKLSDGLKQKVYLKNALCDYQS